MERNYQVASPTLTHPDELHWRTAFHEAGHAAAIHILNQRKQLPPVFFEIQVKRPQQNRRGFCAQVIDGKLIQNLPIAIIETMSPLVKASQHSCQQAYEADIVNLLAGPLSEAKYIALRDGEIFKRELVDLKALRHYGGHSDLETAKCYLEHFIASKNEREQKLAELLAEAHRFVEDSRYWKCVSHLAYFILDGQQEIISCDEAINILDSCLMAPQHIRWGEGLRFSRRETFAGRL